MGLDWTYNFFRPNWFTILLIHPFLRYTTLRWISLIFNNTVEYVTTKFFFSSKNRNFLTWFANIVKLVTDGLEFMERSLRVLGSDFFHHCRDKTVILHVIHTAMESDLPSCNKGILSLIIDVKHICRALSNVSISTVNCMPKVINVTPISPLMYNCFADKDKTMEYLTKLIMSKVWTDDEELGVLVPKAICRLGCLLTKANAPIRNGICEVCDRGIHFYEPSNCKMQQIREFIRILIQRGSIAVS